MRFLSLLVEHLPTRVEVLLNPQLTEQPLVVLRTWDGNVLDASPEAMSAGIGPGDSRRRVEQLCPRAVIVPGQEPLYQAYHDRLKSVAAAFAPAVETGPLGELYIEVGSLARTFPSEKALALTLAAQAQQATSLQPTVGIAANKYTAFQAARQAEDQNSRVLAVSQGHERSFLAPLPLVALPNPPPEVVRRLSLFGLVTLGGLAQLPRAAFLLQFGPELAHLHDLARGLDARPLEAKAPPPSITRHKVLPEPLLDRAPVITLLERMAGRIAEGLCASSHHALALSLVVQTADGQTHTTGGPLKPPSADAAQLCRAVAGLLDKLILTAGITKLEITAYPLREWHLSNRQVTLFETPVPAKVQQLLIVLGEISRKFGEWMMKLASTVGPPLPVPIKVRLGRDNRLVSIAWRGWKRRVIGVYEHWRERPNRWDAPSVRDYFQVAVVGELIFTVFRDEQGRWFLDRRR